VRPLCLLLFLVLAAPVSAGARSSLRGLEDAVAARSLLGADSWCRIVRIENSAPRGPFHCHDYPKVVYAAVFELSGLLWFYTDTDGTQSLSLTTGTALRDEANPGPLFLALYHGFTRWSWVDDPIVATDVATAPPNGCFVESVACLLRRVATGAEARSPRLLSFYVGTANGILGHTVLVYGTSRGLAAVDPGVSLKPIDIPGEVGDSPIALSTYLRGSPVSSARTLPLRCGRDRPGLIAQASGPGGGTG
jgi:hypothetical protein